MKTQNYNYKKLGIVLCAATLFSFTFVSANASGKEPHSSHQHESDTHVSSKEHCRAIHSWTRATKSKEALIFVEIENKGNSKLVLTGAAAPFATSAQLVAFQMVKGRETYTPIGKLPIAPHSKITLKPYALAFQLHGLKIHLKHGHEVEMELEFSQGNKTFHLPIHVQIEDADAKQHSHAGHAH